MLQEMMNGHMVVLTVQTVQQQLVIQDVLIHLLSVQLAHVLHQILPLGQ